MKTLTVTTLPVGQMAANCYIISDYSGDAIIVDPGDDAEHITDTIASKKLQPTSVVATHGHFDHIMAGFAVQHAYGIPFFIHASDNFLVARMRETAVHFLGISVVDPPPAPLSSLTDKDKVPLGGTHLEVIGTPGHTPGSVALYHADSQFVIVGDTVFADGAVGRTDHAYSSKADLERSIKIIMHLPANTRILPGHGRDLTVDLAKRHLRV